MSLAQRWIACCSCPKVKNVATNVWVENEVIVEGLKGLPVSHGYCDECIEVVRAEMREHQKKNHPEQ